MTIKTESIRKALEDVSAHTLRIKRVPDEVDHNKAAAALLIGIGLLFAMPWVLMLALGGLNLAAVPVPALGYWTVFVCYLGLVALRLALWPRRKFWP